MIRRHTIAAVQLVAAGVCMVAAPSCTAPSTAGRGVAERSPVPENINERFLDPELDPEAWKNRWEVESREIYASRYEIVAALELDAGDAIADVGTGTGLFLELFSDAVGPTGRVYALDIAPSFIEHVARRADEEGLENVTPVLSKEDSTTLARGVADVVFVCDTYHHFEYHEAMLGSIHRALRPGGRLVVIDFERIPGVSRDWILGHVRAGKEVFTAEIEAAGFELLDEVAVAGLEENYCRRFVKR